MTSVKHEEDERVQLLTDRLKKLRLDLKEFHGCRHVADFQVHPLLREEIARLYDEHGGIEIISKLTKISYKTIKEWRTKYKRNPLFFRQMPLHPPFYRPLSAHNRIQNSPRPSPRLSPIPRREDNRRNAFATD